jgi:hypothetical protein
MTRTLISKQRSDLFEVFRFGVGIGEEHEGYEGPGPIGEDLRDLRQGHPTRGWVVHRDHDPCLGQHSGPFQEGFDPTAQPLEIPVIRLRDVAQFLVVVGISIVLVVVLGA